MNLLRDVIVRNVLRDTVNLLSATAVGQVVVLPPAGHGQRRVRARGQSPPTREWLLVPLTVPRTARSCPVYISHPTRVGPVVTHSLWTRPLFIPSHFALVSVTVVVLILRDAFSTEPLNLKQLRAGVFPAAVNEEDKDEGVRSNDSGSRAV